MRRAFRFDEAARPTIQRRLSEFVGHTLLADRAIGDENL